MIKKQEIDNPEEQFGCFWLSVKAVVVDQEQQKVLVLKRSKKEKFHTGAYDLPGGHMDKGESVAECLKREIKDETGLEVEVGDMLSIREYPKEHEMFDKIKALRFIAYYKGGEVKLSEEHSEFEWLTFDEVKIKLASDKLKKGDRGYEEEKKDTILLAEKYLTNHGAVEKWQRAIADFENYKKQTAKQNEEFKKYATENVITEILPVIDNFQASLEHIPEEEKTGGWVTGILYIQKQLVDVLASHGVEPMNIQIGDAFDANLHEAVSSKQGSVNSEQESKEERGERLGLEEEDGSEADIDGKGRASRGTDSTDKNITITKIIKNGYKIGDKIIRPAMVETE